VVGVLTSTEPPYLEDEMVPAMIKFVAEPFSETVMLNSLKEKDVQRLLNTMLIKARHLNTCFIFTLQSYLYMPKMLRKQTTFATIFKPKNREEWDSLNKELIQMRDEDARQLFEYVYDKEYSHLDIDTIEGKLYRNFNELTIKKPGDI